MKKTSDGAPLKESIEFKALVIIRRHNNNNHNNKN